jgi:hypothetical protein
VASDNPFEKEPVGVIDVGRLIFTFIVLFALLAFLGLHLYYAVTAKDQETWARVKDASQVILPIVTGILGTVVAFYFGKSKN